MQDHPAKLSAPPLPRSEVPPRKPLEPQTAAGDHVVRGTIFGLIAAVGYTAANVFLRSSVNVDPYWVSCVKAAPTVVLFGPWLLVYVARGQRLFPTPKTFAILLIAAVLGQVGGNVVFQWALGEIGIALTVPLCLGAMIITGAWLGWATLGEAITGRTLASIVVLILAVAILRLGAPTALPHVVDSLSRASLGVAAACLSGVSYALLGVAIRGAARQGCPAATTLVTVGLAGILILGPLCVRRIGIDGMLATDLTSLRWMIAAGLANAVAFIALTKSLELVGVIYVNALNATQAAMAAAAGIILFHEPPSAALVIGVSLTALGLLLMKRRDTPKLGIPTKSNA